MRSPHIIPLGIRPSEYGCSSTVQADTRYQGALPQYNQTYNTAVTGGLQQQQ